MPVFGGKWRKRSIAASNPPADPPMPTIGQPKFSFRAYGRDFVAIGLDRADLVTFSFPRERDVLFDVGFAAMAFLMFNGSASITQASIARTDGTRWIGSSECRGSRRGSGSHCGSRVTGDAVHSTARPTVNKFDQNTAVRSLETESINRGSSLEWGRREDVN